MKPVKLVNGYGKVNPTDEEDVQLENSRLPTKIPNHKRHILFILSFSLCLTLLICAIVTVFIHGCTTKSPPKTTDSIRSVCMVTRYPNSCFTSISSYSVNNKTSDPELIFALSLRVAADELTNLTSLPIRLISESNDPGSVAALKDCVSLFDDALSQLNESMASVRVNNGEKLLTDEKIRDLNTWISAAMTDQETCLDGLQEMGSTVVDEVRVKVQKCSEYMSNSLSILSKIHSLLIKFGSTMH